MTDKNYNVDFSEQDLKIIIKALSYLCVSTLSRSEYLYAHGLENKFKELILKDKENEDSL